MAYDEYIGKSIKNLKILSIIYSRYKKTSMYTAHCICKCGNKKDINISSILSGRTTSCGCYSKQRSRENTTHGMSRSKEYKAFNNMTQRCDNSNNKNYHKYGGRGIKCEWGSFEEFYNDMGNCPDGKSSIDRLNNDRNYCKDNCTWSDNLQQMRNTWRSCYWVIDGVRYSSRRDAAEKLGIPGTRVVQLAKKIPKYNNTTLTEE